MPDARMTALGQRNQRARSRGEKLDWDRDGADWPNRTASRFVDAAGYRWHVQVAGQGPVALLLHGTGASTHSWRDLLPVLAPSMTVVAPDLPGHGFTDTPWFAGMSLPGMAMGLSALLKALRLRPDFAVGHSAGAAILARMILDGAIAPAGLVSLNGAMLPLGGAPARLFSPMAKMLAAIPAVPALFARRASDPAMVKKLLDSTGSRLDQAGAEFYRRLASHPGHVGGALSMMANWDLRPLERDLPRLAVPLTLVVGGKDGTIPPADAERIKSLVPSATIMTLPGLGHLAHEERPAELAGVILARARAAGLATTGAAP